MTLWRCETCGRAVRAEAAPECHGRPMKAIAREAQKPRGRCCLGRRKGL